MTSKSKKTLNKENLIELGAEQLADLLLEISQGNAVSQRILRTALAGSLGYEEAAKEIRKRMTTIDRAKSYIDYDKKKVFLKDLEGLKNQILKQVFPHYAGEALDLMWRLLRLSNGILNRANDESGVFHSFFFSVAESLCECATQAKEKPYILAERIFEDIFENDYGQYDGLISRMAKALGNEGLEILKTKLLAEKIKKDEGYILDIALEAIATEQNDVDGYIALKSKSKSNLIIPSIAADIANRLLKVGRIEEAWEAVERADCVRFRYQIDDWAEVKIAVLAAQEKHEEAQSFRYKFFQEKLSISMLKDYLKHVPEFEEFKEEQKALEFIKGYKEIHNAISFLTQWHAPKHLNEMVLNRHKEIDGDYYELLPNAAKALSSNYPLGATIILRKLIDHTLEHAKSRRYKYAAKDFLTCVSLCKDIQDYYGHLTHNEYEAEVKKSHGKKNAFWTLIPS